MADDTSAALIAQLDVKFDQLASNMRKAMTVFDNGGRAIERRQQQIKKNIEQSWNSIGRTIVGGAALAGIEQFVSGIVDAGGKIKDTSDALHVGTDELQAWGILAGRAGTSQEAFNGAIEKFGKNIGDAAIKGGDAAKFYKKLGIDIHADVTTAFYQLADAVQKVKDPQQQLTLVTKALGKSAGNLTPVLAQGGDALKSIVAQMAASGQIIQRDAIDKIDDLGDAWSDLKRQFQAAGGNALAEPLKKLTDELKDPSVQEGLKTFAGLLADIAVQMAKAAKYAPALAGAYAGFRVGRLAGVPGAIAGAAVGGIVGDALSQPRAGHEQDGLSQLEKLQRQAQGLNSVISGRPLMERLLGESSITKKARQDLAVVETQIKAIQGAAAPAGKSKGKSGGNSDLTDLLGGDALKAQEGRNTLADLAAHDAKQTRDAVLSANADIRESDQATWDARRDTIRVQDDAMLQLAQGTDDYYSLQKQVIAELASLDIQSINERRDAELAALKERSAAEDKEASAALAARKRQLDDLVGQDKISRPQANVALSSFEEQQTAQRQQRQTADTAKSVSIEQEAALQITAINVKKNADLQQADEEYFQTKQKLIQLNDAVRQGLEDVGVAGLHGFGSLKDAAAQALDQIAQMIVQLYVMKPLVEGLFGKTGTTGGGLFGGLISSLFGGSSLATNTSAAIAANPLLFSGGGYTGSGGKNQPAGIVHKGEVVFSQDDVQRFGGPGVVDAMRRRGYANGGIVGGWSAPAMPRISAPAGMAPTIIQHFDLTGAVVTDDLFRQMNQTASAHATAAVRNYDKAVLPSRVADLRQNPRKR